MHEKKKKACTQKILYSCRIRGAVRKIKITTLYARDIYLFIYLFYVYFVNIFSVILCAHFRRVYRSPHSIRSTVGFHSHLLTLFGSVSTLSHVVAFVYSFQLGLAKMLIHSALTSVSVFDYTILSMQRATTLPTTLLMYGFGFLSLSLSRSLFHFC